VVGADGNFYGANPFGGEDNWGTVFKIMPGGALTVLHTFNDYYDHDGALPNGLVQATDGSFYGTAGGGPMFAGIVFKITFDGTLTTLHAFDRTDGQSPLAPPIQGSDGNFYGTTSEAGPNGYGTVYKMSPQGSLMTLHSFNHTDGAAPYAQLVQASDGNFYGTTTEGGANGYGTVFKITPQGTLSTLHSFNIVDGLFPYGTLVQATDGNFYGTTNQGGGNDTCFQGCGTIFKITATGVLTTVHTFDSTDGYNPYGGLVQAADGSFYGTTTGGGASGDGTVFRLIVYPVLSVAKLGLGTVTSEDGHIYCGSACSYWYFDGSQINLSALPAPGYTFAGWTGCDNVNGSYCSMTMAGAKNVVASFATANITLTSLTFKPSYVRGGQVSAGTLTLNAPAPSGGVTVALSSDHPGVAHPPSFVFVPGGQTSAGFAVRTFPVKSNTTVMIAATAGNSHVSGTLTVGTAFVTPSLR